MAGGVDRRRSGDGDYLWLVGLGGLIFFWPQISAWGSVKLGEIVGSKVVEQLVLMAPILLAGLVCSVLLLLLRTVFRKVRHHKRDMISAVLQELLPKSWDATHGVRIGWYVLSARPRRVIVTYPPESPDRDMEWRQKVTGMVAYRAGMETSLATWDTEKLKVSVVALKPVEEVPLTPEEKHQESVVARVRLVLAPLFGTDVRVSITEWTNAADDAPGGHPMQIEITYDPTTRDASPNWRRRLEAVIALKVPPGDARWSANYETSADRIILRRRPPLPENLVHPGPMLWSGQHGIILPYGVDEHGDLVSWAITGSVAKRRPTIHTLIIGPTGAGKTSVMRSLLIAATGQGVWILGGDPKRIELTPFRGWPGVLAVASTAEDLGYLIRSVKQLMDDRYRLIEEGAARADDMAPVLLILDELLILRGTLNRWWNANKGEGTLTEWGTKSGTQHPALGMITEMLALARSANIRIVEGVQRPDATLFEEGSRDNLRHRVSLNRLSPQGAEMLWGDSFTGTDTPMVAGRGMASPDGSVPVETQMFWTPDPRDEQHRELVESLRGAAEAAIKDQPIPEGLDLSALSDVARHVPECASAAAEIASVVQHTETLSTQLVGAGEIMQGDKVLTDDGIAEVLTAEVIENPDDAETWDWVRLLLRDAQGERVEEAPTTADYARVIE